MTEKTTCPRRITEFGLWEQEEGLDKWEKREHIADEIKGLQCSFCGWLHPDDFIALVQNGAEVIPTDKSYKAYLHYEGRQIKFYYKHLSIEQVKILLEMHNKGRMNMGYPGFFYTTPLSMIVTSAPPFSFSAIITVEWKIYDGEIISFVDPVYRYLIDEIKKDSNIICQIEPRVWEEIIAAAYDKAGFDEVILTPISGDYGRDVIATKKGFGSVKFIEQVKAYSAGHIVKADEVRALLGVLQAEQDATKAIFTTTSFFAPKIKQDKLIKPFLPYRLELIDRDRLIERLIKTID